MYLLQKHCKAMLKTFLKFACIVSGIPGGYLALPGMPGLAGMSIAGGAMSGLVSSASPLTGSQLAVAGAQYPGLSGNDGPMVFFVQK